MLANESTEAALDSDEAEKDRVVTPGMGSPGQLAETGGPSESAVDPTTYRLAAGDVIDVKFTFHPEENQRVPVHEDGSIRLPVTGAVPAAGRTVAELAASIVEKSAASLREPEVSILIVELAEHRVFVTGQVARPGFVPFRPGLTPLQAVLERGGLLSDANTDQVIHLRRIGPRLARTQIDLSEEIAGRAPPDGVTLAPDDILIVPRTFIGDAGVFVDQWIRGLLPSIPRPGYDLPLLFF